MSRERRHVGAEVVNLVLLLKRSNGKWFHVAIEDYDAKEKLHLLRFYNESPSPFAPSSGGSNSNETAEEFAAAAAQLRLANGNYLVPTARADWYDLNDPSREYVYRSGADGKELPPATPPPTAPGVGMRVQPAVVAAAATGSGSGGGSSSAGGAGKSQRSQRGSTASNTSSSTTGAAAAPSAGAVSASQREAGAGTGLTADGQALLTVVPVNGIAPLVLPTAALQVPSAGAGAGTGAGTGAAVTDGTATTTVQWTSLPARTPLGDRVLYVDSAGTMFVLLEAPVGRGETTGSTAASSATSSSSSSSSKYPPRLVYVAHPTSLNGRAAPPPVLPPPGGWAVLQAGATDPLRLLHRRIRLYWPLDGEWFGGRISRYDAATGKHFIRFDDGDEHGYVLADREWRLYDDYCGEVVGQRLAVEWPGHVWHVATVMGYDAHLDMHHLVYEGSSRSPALAGHEEVVNLNLREHMWLVSVDSLPEGEKVLGRRVRVYLPDKQLLSFGTITQYTPSTAAPPTAITAAAEEEKEEEEEDEKEKKSTSKTATPAASTAAPATVSTPVRKRSRGGTAHAITSSPSTPLLRGLGNSLRLVPQAEDYASGAAAAAAASSGAGAGGALADVPSFSLDSFTAGDTSGATTADGSSGGGGGAAAVAADGSATRAPAAPPPPALPPTLPALLTRQPSYLPAPEKPDPNARVRVIHDDGTKQDTVLRELCFTWLPDRVPGHPPAPGALGLLNLGNTCYLNSILQCLSHVEPLTAYCMDDSFPNHLNLSNKFGLGGRLALAYSELVQHLWKDSAAVAIAPAFIKALLSEKDSTFIGMGQQDAHEALMCLLNGVHEDLAEPDAAASAAAAADAHAAAAEEEEAKAAAQAQGSAQANGKKKEGKRGGLFAALRPGSGSATASGAESSTSAATSGRPMSAATTTASTDGVASTDTQSPAAVDKPSKGGLSGWWRRRTSSKTTAGLPGGAPTAAAEAAAANMAASESKESLDLAVVPEGVESGPASAERRGSGSSLSSGGAAAAPRPAVPITETTSIIKRLFFVHTLTELSCARNKVHVTVRYGPRGGEMLPPLPLAPVVTEKSGLLRRKVKVRNAELTDCLDNFFSPAPLERGCEKCKRGSSSSSGGGSGSGGAGASSSTPIGPAVSSRTWLTALPPVLVINLKRFEWTQQPIVSPTNAAGGMGAGAMGIGAAVTAAAFGGSGGGGGGGSQWVHCKLVQPIHFPLRGLDMAPYVHSSAAATALAPAANSSSSDGPAATTGGTTATDSSSSSSLYDLFGVVCHVGTVERGHYTAYARAAGTAAALSAAANGASAGGEAAAAAAASAAAAAAAATTRGCSTDCSWYYYDDSKVIPAQENDVQQDSVACLAYLLFYMRRIPGYAIAEATPSSSSSASSRSSQQLNSSAAATGEGSKGVSSSSNGKAPVGPPMPSQPTNSKSKGGAGVGAGGGAGGGAQEVGAVADREREAQEAGSTAVNSTMAMLMGTTGF